MYSPPSSVHGTQYVLTLFITWLKASKMFKLGQLHKLPCWGGVGEMRLIGNAEFIDDCDSGYSGGISSEGDVDSDCDSGHPDDDTDSEDESDVEESGEDLN